MEYKDKVPFSVTMGPVHLVMIVALIIGSYYFGTLKTKVDFLQNENTLGANVGNNAQPQPQQPREPLVAKDIPEITKDDWVKGDRNAPIALIEYSDLECPFCKSFRSTAQRVVDEYKGKVMWVYRHYPLSFHVNAQKESEAAECAGELGGNESFWKYIDAIYDRSPAGGQGFALDQLAPLAVEIGLNETAFKECLDSGKMAQKVKDQMAAGTKSGVTGTPGNIILNMKTKENRLIPGALPFEQIQPVIDELLAE